VCVCVCMCVRVCVCVTSVAGFAKKYATPDTGIRKSSQNGGDLGS